MPKMPAKGRSGDKQIEQSQIERTILWLRGTHVVIDADLAEFYGVSTKQLNQAVKRNSEKFPADFLFRLTAEEKDEVVTNCDHLESLKFSRTAPHAFTEHGVLMAASILRSEHADAVSVAIIRAFVRLREIHYVERDGQTHLPLAAPKRLPALRKSGQSALQRRMNKFLTDVRPKLEQAVNQVLDTVIDKQKGTTIREEAQGLLSESLEHLHSKLKKAGLENNEISARIAKLVAEAERTRQEARKASAEADQLEFINLVKRLRLVLEAHKAMSFGALEESDFLTEQVDSLLKALEKLTGK